MLEKQILHVVAFHFSTDFPHVMFEVIKSETICNYEFLIIWVQIIPHYAKYYIIELNTDERPYQPSKCKKR